MNLKTTRTVVTVLISISMLACVGGLVFASGDEAALTNYGIAAIVCLFLVVGVICKWGRCPWCGHILFRKFFALKVCPNCGRDLETGKKKKGKGGKR